MGLKVVVEVTTGLEKLNWDVGKPTAEFRRCGYKGVLPLTVAVIADNLRREGVRIALDKTESSRISEASGVLWFKIKAHLFVYVKSTLTWFGDNINPRLTSLFNK